MNLFAHWTKLNIYNWVLIFAVFILIGQFYGFAHAQEEPKKDKNYYQQQIQKIDQEIKQYEQQLNQVQKSKKTLQSSLSSLNLSTKYTETKIKKTKSKISLLENSIEQLEEKINKTQKKLQDTKDKLAEMIRKFYIASDKNYVEILLQHDKISDAFDELVQISSLQGALAIQKQELEKTKAQLKNALEEKILTQKNLTEQQKNLLVQKRSLEIKKKEKAKLLAQTKNQESLYQKLLEEKRKARAEFEKALQTFEAGLAYNKKTGLPKKGDNVFIWPLSRVRITQYFGNTPFARSGAYRGNGHNGIDMGIPIGTPVYAAADGNVLATGNTDAYPGCLSYGKWILIKHTNGLATMYAHLSQVAKSPGQAVKQGDVIAYSGSTGYSTGPHLHFSVYDGDAVRVVRLGDVKYSRRCANARIPVAPWKAYFNPLDFLTKR